MCLLIYCGELSEIRDLPKFKMPGRKERRQFHGGTFGKHIEPKQEDRLSDL